MGENDVNRKKDNNFETYRKRENPEEMKIWGILIFGLIGATATTFAVTNLRRTIGWLYTQLTRSPSSKGASGSSFRTAFQEEARKRYYRRMQEEREEELERLERIRRMQKVFRERSQFKRSYESWKEYGPGTYHQEFQRDDWYWKTEKSYRERDTNYNRRTSGDPASFQLSHHYTILGLDRSRKTPYTDAEIKDRMLVARSVSERKEFPELGLITKNGLLRPQEMKLRSQLCLQEAAIANIYLQPQTAFRTKAMQFHPDQNQNNKEAAETKFKQVMTSYEAIKQERKNMKS